MEIKYIIFGDEVIKLVKGIDGFWYNDEGTIFALQNTESCIDDKPACGVGPLSLPEDSPLTPACAVHDYMYSSPVYQAFHTREDADKELKRLLREVSQNSWQQILVQPFYWLSRVFGGLFWEGKKSSG